MSSLGNDSFTPGPWEIVSRFIGPLYIVADVDKTIDRSGKMDVAHVGAETMMTAQANAQLIAAAPDLYAALKAMVELYVKTVKENDTARWNPEMDSAVIAARSALSKARGEKE